MILSQTASRYSVRHTCHTPTDTDVINSQIPLLAHNLLALYESHRDIQAYTHRHTLTDSDMRHTQTFRHTHADTDPHRH